MNSKKYSKKINIQKIKKIIVIIMDICGPFPTGEYIFTITDAYSR